MNRIVGAAAVAALFFTAVAGAAGSRDEGKICTMEKTVGSHMPRRICTTAAEREATRKADQDAMSRMKTMGRTSGSPARN